METPSPSQSQSTTRPAFSVYPNPVIDELFIEWHVRPLPRLTFVIFDMEGKAIQTGNLQVKTLTQSIKVDALAKGSYEILIIDEPGRFGKMPFVKK